MHAKQRLPWQIKFLQQGGGQEFRTVAAHLQTYRLAKLAVSQLFAQRRAQIIHLVFFHQQLGIARDAKLHRLYHFAAIEQLRNVGTHHAGEANKQPLFATNTGGHLHQTRQGTRQLHNRHLIGATKSIATFEAHHHVQRFIGNLRERMRRIQCHGHQQRLDGLLKVAIHPTALRRCAGLVMDDANARRGKCWHQSVVVERVLARHQLLRFAQQGQAIGHVVDALRLGIDGHDVRGRAHLKKFIEVGGNNAQIAQALQQGYIFAPRPRHHALVESQDTVVTRQQSQGGSGSLRRRQSNLLRHWHRILRQCPKRRRHCNEWFCLWIHENSLA